MTDNERRVACNNCEWTGNESDVAPFHDFWSRIETGDIMPAGDCPECGAFASLIASPTRDTISRALKDNVCLAPATREILGGRCGTVHTSLDAFQARFGPPTVDYGPDDCDGKVTKSWHFDTPRGPIEVRDYWWNGPRELSMGSTSFKAALWLAGCLRRVGIKANLGS